MDESGGSFGALLQAAEVMEEKPSPGIESNPYAEDDPQRASPRATWAAPAAEHAESGEDTMEMPPSTADLVGAVRSWDTHNAIERRRRAYLAKCYSELQEVVPTTANRKASNIMILRGAAAYIDDLLQDEARLEEAKSYERRRCAFLRARLAAAQSSAQRTSPYAPDPRVPGQAVAPHFEDKGPDAMHSVATTQYQQHQQVPQRGANGGQGGGGVAAAAVGHGYSVAGNAVMAPHPMQHTAVMQQPPPHLQHPQMMSVPHGYPQPEYHQMSPGRPAPMSMSMSESPPNGYGQVMGYTVQPQPHDYRYPHPYDSAMQPPDHGFVPQYQPAFEMQPGMQPRMQADPRMLGAGGHPGAGYPMQPGMHPGMQWVQMPMPYGYVNQQQPEVMPPRQITSEGHVHVLRQGAPMYSGAGRAEDAETEEDEDDRVVPNPRSKDLGPRGTPTGGLTELEMQSRPKILARHGNFPPQPQGYYHAIPEA
eukprot:m.26715 g.26715  ORF g.26715 m.26715 type:complete len:478 (+) comp6347_c0_seq2:190-1623(+)